MNFFTACLGIMCLGSISLHAQNTDTLLSAKKGVAYAVDLYRRSTEATQHLYNGPEYFIYDSHAEEHQFFESDDLEAGSVYYNGQFYPSVLLMYDIVKDEVAIEHLYGYDQVQLQKDKVAYFTLLDHRFIRLEKANTGLRTGFYELLYDKKLKVISKRIKNREEVIEGMKVVTHFPAKSLFYIYKDNKYHSVSSKGSVLTSLEDQKKALRKYMREKQLRFRKDRENAIIKLAAYYDQLTQ